jgi:hypothetical protein
MKNRLKEIEGTLSTVRRTIHLLFLLLFMMDKDINCARCIVYRLSILHNDNVILDFEVLFLFRPR